MFELKVIKKLPNVVAPQDDNIDVLLPWLSIMKEKNINPTKPPK
jgi:hypothetical protein